MTASLKFCHLSVFAKNRTDWNTSNINRTDEYSYLLRFRSGYGNSQQSKHSWPLAIDLSFLENEMVVVAIFWCCFDVGRSLKGSR